MTAVAVAVAVALLIVVGLLLWDRARLLGERDALLDDLRSERQARDSREREWTERFVSMRKEGFTAGGETAPEPPTPIPAEIERFIARTPLEMQAETRAWAREMVEANVPVPEIMSRLDGHGDEVSDLVMGLYG